MAQQDVSIDLEPMFAEGQDFGTPFEVNLNIEVEDGTPFNVTLTGTAAVLGKERYVAFDTLADGDTPIGRIQREWARLNSLFIVDSQKVTDTLARLIEKEQSNAKAKAKKAKEPEIVAFRIVSADPVPVEVGQIVMFKDVMPKGEFGFRYGEVQGTGEVVFGIQLKNQADIDKQADAQAKADAAQSE